MTDDHETGSEGLNARSDKADKEHRKTSDSNEWFSSWKRRTLLQSIALTSLSGMGLAVPSATAQDETVIFHNTFSDAGKDRNWYFGPISDMWPRQGPRDYIWSEKYDGSIELAVWERPSSVEMWKTVPVMPRETEITVLYSGLSHRRYGNLSLYVRSPNETWESLDRDSARNRDNDGKLRATLDEEYPEGSEILIRLDILPGCEGPSPSSMVFIKEVKAVRKPSNTPHTLMITANEGGVEYDLKVKGDVKPQQPQGDFSADGNETIEENDDRTITAKGLTGPAPRIADERSFLGDRYLFSGSVREFGISPRSDDTTVNIYLDEQQVSPQEVRRLQRGAEGTHSLMITANQAGVDYLFAVDGTLEPQSPEGDFSAGDGESITEESDGTIRVVDQTGPAPRHADAHAFLGDRFLIDGEILDLSLKPGKEDTDVNLYFDEHLMSKENIVSRY